MPAATLRPRQRRALAAPVPLPLVVVAALALIALAPRPPVGAAMPTLRKRSARLPQSARRASCETSRAARVAAGSGRAAVEQRRPQLQSAAALVQVAAACAADAAANPIGTGGVMQTVVTEVAERIYQLSTYVPAARLRFNLYLIDADAPLLFHCGQRQLFPLFSAALATLMPIERLRWISYGHFEADECGALNDWLRAAPGAQAAVGQTGCRIAANDFARRAPRALADDEAIDLGGRRVRFLATPHVPHCWDAGLLYEEATGTLLCGDLFAQPGDGAPVTSDDIVAPALAAEDQVHATALTPATAPTLRRLAALKPATLALMHGPTFRGDGARALDALADGIAQRLAAATDAARA